MGSLGVRLTAIGDRLRVHAPKGKLPTDLRAQIAERKAEILAYLGEHSPAKRSIPPPIHPRATDAPAPLSFAQERLWFLEQLEPQSAVYNVCRAVRIGGNLNVSAIEAALNEILRRHQTLRTAFRLIDGQAVQIVQPFGHLAIDTIDLRPLSEGDRDVEIKRLIKADAEQPFDLHGGSLLRCKLLRVGDAEHILILVTHHAASDAWSMGILTRELWTLYQAYPQGKPSPLEPLPVQYSDYAIWQRDWLQGEVMEAQLSYWKEQLKELPILNLPTDRSRKPRQSFSGARLGITFPAELTTAINELSHRHGITPFMTLLAAFQVLLYRYSEQEDFALGSPIANRRRPEIEGLIGFFVNTLVFRADISGNPSFAEVLSRVKDTCIGANANQDLPFEKLVQELQPERDASRNPLFQVLFVLQNATRPFTGVPGLRIEPVETQKTLSHFDLSFFLREREGRYIGYFEYSTDLFDRSTIERMAIHYRTLLEAAVTDPDQSVGTLPILTEAERHQLLVEWNDTAGNYPKDKCIHQLFETQVELTPNAVALEFNGESLTYRELNARSNQLAHHLRALGVGPEEVVGICVERSFEMVIGLLGILKAGAAYLPLDPDYYPPGRLVQMIQRCNAPVVISKRDLARQLSRHSSTLVYMDSQWDQISRNGETNPACNTTADSLAYVMYTSGSTGEPKGVTISHKAVVNHMSWAQLKFSLGVNDRVLHKTSLNFDASVWEIFAPLLVGALMIIARRGGHQQTDYLIELINTRHVTVLKVVPTLLQMFLEDDFANCQSLRHVLCGGEPLSVELSQTFFRCSRARLHNLYGPTEATIDATFYDCGSELSRSLVSIGKPISNTAIYILDKWLQPVPIGVPGELHIGGDALARGYLDPGLDNERFIPNPFVKRGNARLYKTGDIGKYRPDGNIEYLGRTDRQIKLRGIRIEPGEIETALNQHPNVTHSLVTLQPRPNSDGALVAYFVSAMEPPPPIADLRRFLRTVLPDHMIPTAFGSVKSLPLQSSGKIDRNTSPREATWLEGSATPVPPGTHIERLVAQTWREMLNISDVGINHNFFELGGHSLLAIQIVSRLQDIFDCKIPLSLIFEAPTVADISRHIYNMTRMGLPLDVPILSSSRENPLPLSMNQEHIWYLDRMIPGTPFFNIPHVFHLSGALNVSALEYAIGEIVRRHEALRTIFVQVKEQPLQVVQKRYSFRLPSIDLRCHPSESLAQQTADFILAERQAPFDLGAGPVVRFTLLRLADFEYLLLITIHHIVSDYWSLQILYRELALLYNAFALNRVSPLREPALHLADVAYWERTSLDDGRFQAHLRYWTGQLCHSTPRLLFQHHDAEETELNFQTSHESIEIPEDIFGIIKSLAVSENCTPFVVLLTALTVILHFHTGNNHIRIGTLMANRGRTEVQGVFGYLANTVIICAHVRRDSTFKQILRQVRDTVLMAHIYADLPFEYLAQVLEQDSHIPRSSLFQVLLIYHGLPSQGGIMDGITFAPLRMQRLARQSNVTITGYDLIFHLREMATKLTGAVTYKSQLFTRSDIDVFIRSITSIFRSMKDGDDLRHLRDSVR